MEPLPDSRRTLLLALAITAGAIAASLLLRPVLPPDEQRWLSVAWEMHRDGTWLVPTLDGEAYHHKPPLLFWLVRALWLIFGVADWPARLAAPLAGIASVGLAWWIGRLLWRDRPAAAGSGVIVLAGGWAWLAFAGLSFADLLLCAGVLLTVVGALRAAAGASGVAMVAAGLGIGLLAKGPVALAFVIPALGAIGWAVATAPRRGWWLRMGAGMAIGIIVALAWAVPAAIAGGRTYAAHLLWTQTAGRLVDSFAHDNGPWLYPAMLPVLLMPWLLWPPAWRSAAAACRQTDPGLRMLLVWIAGSIIVLSLISAKQPHYLLPVLPAIALVVGRWWDAVPPIARDWRDHVPLAAVLIVAGLGWAMAVVSGHPRLPDWVGAGAWWPGVAIAGVGLAAVLVVRWRGASGPSMVAVAGVAAVSLAWAGLGPSLRAGFDPTPIALAAAQVQAAGHPVAVVGTYHGELGFAGRLPKPLIHLEEIQVWSWCHANPDGAVLIRTRAPSPLLGPPSRQIVWRGRRHLGLYPASGLAGSVGWHPPMSWPPFPPAPAAYPARETLYQ